VRPPTATLTFPDVAPIFHTGAAPAVTAATARPFPLLAYDDARAHAGDRRRVPAFMPPWLPEPGHIAFHGDRRLADGEIAAHPRLVAAGALRVTVAGPHVPRNAVGLQLGAPDLIVRTPEPYRSPRAAASLPYFRLTVPILDGAVASGGDQAGSRGAYPSRTLFTDATGEHDGSDA